MRYKNITYKTKFYLIKNQIHRLVGSKLLKGASIAEEVIGLELKELHTYIMKINFII